MNVLLIAVLIGIFSVVFVLFILKQLRVISTNPKGFIGGSILDFLLLGPAGFLYTLFFAPEKNDENSFYLKEDDITKDNGFGDGWILPGDDMDAAGEKR